MSEPLRLRAEEAEDIAVLSAALQDSVLQMGDLVYDAKARRFTATINRFRWESAGANAPFERVRAALAFEGVTGVRSARVRREDKDAVASLLSLAFAPDAEPPGGKVTIVLAGGGEIELSVECVDAVLIDLGAPWPTPRKPSHEAA
ncbi:MAG: DUF2948 family protein [Hyphomonadaceae bacterium]